MTIDLCPNRKDYFTQLNNEQDPKIACQCTTAAQCIAVVDDVSLLKGPFKQPEDNLRFFCRTDPECVDFCKRSHPGSAIHPSEWADALVFAINKLMGCRCAFFEGRMTPQTIVADLVAGLPSMASMKFDNIAGHYVGVVGVKDDGAFIVNDPYRDWLHDGPVGFHCLYTTEDWKNHSKGYGLRFSKRRGK
jgi:hypothetical protein